MSLEAQGIFLLCLVAMLATCTVLVAAYLLIPDEK